MGKMNHHAAVNLLLTRRLSMDSTGSDWELHGTPLLGWEITMKDHLTPISWLEDVVSCTEYIMIKHCCRILLLSPFVIGSLS